MVVHGLRFKNTRQPDADMSQARAADSKVGSVVKLSLTILPQSLKPCDEMISDLADYLGKLSHFVNANLDLVAYDSTGIT